MLSHRSPIQSTDSSGTCHLRIAASGGGCQKRHKRLHQQLQILPNANHHRLLNCFWKVIDRFIETQLIGMQLSLNLLDRYTTFEELAAIVTLFPLTTPLRRRQFEG